MNKNVLITGCSSGIGAALAKTMQAAGYQVFATAREPNKLTHLTPLGIVPLKLDVTDQNNIRQVIEQIIKQHERIDILVNNAGYGAMGPLVEMPRKELMQQFDTNVYGPLALIQAVTPHMIQQGSGLIVNIGSVSGILTTPFSGAYCATKAALHAMSDALRMELAPFNIQVLTVQPGAIESEFGNSAEASLSRTFSENSIYQEVRSSVLKRARASQNKPTPAQDLVNELLEKLDGKPLPATLKVGNGSRIMPLMARLLPSKIKDQILMRTFGLNSAALSHRPKHPE